MEEKNRLILGLLGVLGLSYGGWKKGALDGSGALAALGVGAVTVAAGWRPTAALATFFVTSSAWTRVGSRQKRKIEDGHRVGGQRDWRQVLSNGLGGSLVACALVALRGTREAVPAPRGSLELALLAAFTAHYAAVAGDTWSSEIGVLSPGEPRLVIRPWQTVPRGVNGGMSLLGTMAALAGGATVGAAMLGTSACLLGAKEAWKQEGGLVALGAAAGFVGSLLDSLLGATLQFSGWDEQRHVVVESPRPGVRPICGVDFLSGNAVNFWSVALTSLFAGLLASRLPL